MRTSGDVNLFGIRCSGFSCSLLFDFGVSGFGFSIFGVLDLVVLRIWPWEGLESIFSILPAWGSCFWFSSFWGAPSWIWGYFWVLVLGFVLWFRKSWILGVCFSQEWFAFRPPFRFSKLYRSFYFFFSYYFTFSVLSLFLTHCSCFSFWVLERSFLAIFWVIF